MRYTIGVVYGGIIMPVNYKKLWILLIEKGITKPQLREMSNISTATLTKLNKNEYVALEVLTRICKVLECDIGDIVEVEKDKMGAIL